MKKVTGLILSLSLLFTSTVLAQIKQCNSDSFDYPDFAKTLPLNIVGSATQSNSRLYLSSARKMNFGAVWFNKKLPVSNGFISVFSFRISSGTHGNWPDNSQPGGDGFAFVIQNDNPLALFSGVGSYLGYANINNSIAIEFDTYQNNAQGDLNGNHIAVQSNGKLPNTAFHGTNTLVVNTSIPIIKTDGSQIYYVKTDYQINPNVLKVFLGLDTNFTNPVITVNNLDIASLLVLDCGKLYFGFTAASGDSYENHEILSWKTCAYELNKLTISSSASSFCNTDTIIVYATKGLKNYVWTDENGNVIARDIDSIVVTKPGKYRVKATSNDGCDLTEQEITITDNNNGNSRFKLTDNLPEQTLTFDTCYYPEVYCKKVHIKNLSQQNLILESPYIFYKYSFSVPESQFPMNFNPLEEKEVLICYSSNKLGIEHDTLVFQDKCGPLQINLLANTLPNIFSGPTKCSSLSGKTSSIKKRFMMNYTDFQPNPSQGRTSISFLITADTKNIKIRLFDVFGSELLFSSNDFKLIKNSINKDFIELKAELNLINIINGVYYFQFFANDESVTLPLFIQK
ncbi:MAG: L-type lectin-domain containing protein [Bacteroidota bacterium]